ncbi:MAG: peptide ABC transporter substrate-binding protein, partial [Deltaproteobacteria bacterium]|nr:peptide ABC transporter substrate-binding protein [Deltaproteobacteria bacterium]
MTVKRILIIAPLLLILFLFQSYFWVPTYDQQTRGNPERLNEYITASIGDASMLNPILSADTASSSIESMVFEGLIDRDEELRFRGRLATHWEIYEEAFFYLNEKVMLPGLGKATPEVVLQLIRDARAGHFPTNDETQAALDNIKEISIIPPEVFFVTRHEKGGKDGKDRTIRIKVSAPARIKLTLLKVDQELFTRLSRILGKDYFSTFSAERYLEFEQGVEKEGRGKYALELLPAVEHNPIVLFHLRPDVQFHDGHSFDADDVKFTYEALMNPKNLSPRISDYEPVKQVEVIDPLTVRIAYKRLYSPALGTWAMGILPEHLLNDEAL